MSFERCFWHVSVLILSVAKKKYERCRVWNQLMIVILTKFVSSIRKWNPSFNQKGRQIGKKTSSFNLSLLSKPIQIKISKFIWKTFPFLFEIYLYFLFPYWLLCESISTALQHPNTDHITIKCVLRMNEVQKKLFDKIETNDALFSHWTY